MKQKLTYFYSLLLTALFLLPWNGVKAETLTVADGTATNAEIPVYGWYADTGFKNQFIYSSALLSDIAEGSTISGISFYSATSTLIVGTTAKIVVRFAEVANETFSSAAYLSPTSPATFVEVYNGNFNTLTTSGSDKLLVLDFGENTYTYNGGNLLVEVQLSPKGSSSPNSSFYGVSATGNGLSGYGGTYANKYIRNFLPKATITYTPSAPITCAKPTDLTRTALSATSATFTWTAGGSSTTNLQYKSSGDWNLVENVSSPYVLSGLSPETAYEVQVQSDCGSTDGQSSWTASNSFTTYIKAPWTLDLSDATANTILSGWDISNSTSTTKSGSSTYNIWGVYSAGGTKMLRMCNYSVQAGTALINTPNIVIPNNGKTYELVFEYENSAYKSTTNVPFSVKASKNAGSTFTELGSYDKNSSIAYNATPANWTETSISLADYAGETIILQFFANANYGYGAIFVKNIRIIEASSCTKPSGLEYSNVTTNSVKLNWTAGGSETAWNIQYKADDDADWTTVAITENDLDEGVYTLTGLSDNTHYTVQVQADCGNDVVSEFNVTPVDFPTKCNAFTMPFEQTFNDLTAGIPDCWDNSEGTTTEANYKWNYFATGYDGKCVRFEALYNSTGNDNYLKTPSITISAAARLSFRYKNPKGAALSVYYAIDGGSKTVLQSSFDTKTSWSDKVEIDLSADWVGHNVEFFFRGVSNCSFGDAYIYLDEVSVKAQPTCFAPTGLGYSAVTAEGATLSWTVGKEGDNAWVVEYSKNSDFSSSSSVAATTNPFTLTGLDEQTTYYVRVKTDCGSSEYSEESGAVNFPTKCAAIVLNSLNPTWEENFDDETNETVVACWDNSASTCFSNPAGSTPAKYVWGVIRTGSYGDYKYSIYMRNFNVRAGTALINTPSFTLPSDKNYEFTFKYNHLASCDPLVIKISENGGEFAAIDGASYTNTSGTNSYSDPGTLIEQSIDLSAYKGKTITLQFFTTANYGDGAIWVDDLSIHEKASCTKPTLNDATAQTPEGATFTWTAGGSETQYDYSVVASGETPADWTTISATTVTLTGQAAGTYDFYVRSNCGGTDGVSESVAKSFTTASVNSPANLSVANITNEAASASWDAAAGVSGYEVLCVREDGTKNWDNAAQVATNSVALDTLKASREYTIYVRSYYASATAPATLYGATELSKAFTTKCDPTTVDATHPFSETFDGITSGIPACWDNSEGTTTNANYKWSYFATGHEGKCVRFDSYNNNSARTNVLASPIFKLQVDADLEFWVKNPTGGAYTVQISVNGGDRQDVFTGLTSLTDWVKKEVVLTSYYDAENPKTIQFFFSGTSNNWNNQAYLYLDDFVITPQACRKPASDPVVNSKTGTTASISWGEGGASNYQFAVALKDETPVWDANNVVTATTKTIEGLTPLTNYDFYVRTYCDEDNQSDARKVSFQTECADYVTLPFNEDFNSLSADAIPACWNNDEGTSEDYYKWKAVTYSGHNTSTCVRFNSSTNDADATNVLATPVIKLNEGNLLTFWAKNPTGGDFKVQIEGEGIEREDLLTGLTDIADWTLKYAAIPAKFNNKKVQLFFCATSNEGDADAYIYIDDVRVARGEAFADGENTGVETRLGGLEGQTLDFVMTRPMQYNGYYNTLCLPFSVSESEMAETEHPFYNCTVKAFDYAVVAGEELQLAITAASGIEAGQPCFLKYDGTATADKTVLLFKEVTISAPAPGSKVDGDVTYAGIFNTITATPESEGAHVPSCLFVGGQNGLYWPTTARKMNAFRAYFSITTGAGAPIRRGMSARIVERAEVATGCENVNAAEKAVKLLENGQVIIIRNGVKYNIQGQIISK